MKIQGVAFPTALLDALRDGRLVAFAGAGPHCQFQHLTASTATTRR